MLLAAKDVRRWGIDFGNVLIENLMLSVRGKLITHFKPTEAKFTDTIWCNEVDKFLLENSQLVRNSLIGLQVLIQTVGYSNVWIVSCAKGLERLFNRRLLLVHEVFARTSLNENQVVFVDKMEEKAAVCSNLNIRGHIDDRGEVLFHLQNIVPLLLWFNPAPEDYARWCGQFGSSVKIIMNWNELIDLIK